MGRDDAAQVLRSQLVDALRQRINEAAPESADELRAEFRVLAQDYRTFRLMDEVPAHADGAHSAWRELLPELTDAVSRRQLLALLEAAYLEAVAPLPGAGDGGQAGQ